jgi:hypothetical protein
MSKIMSKHGFWAGALFAVMTMAVATAGATPNPDGIVFHERVFNDCPGSVLSTTDNFPFMVAIEDQIDAFCGGYANLHVWRLATMGSDAVFNNNSAFSISATLTITGTGNGEAGLQISPWWSQLVDGRFNVRSTDGEIACFGGRLPFYSFTADQGLNYTKGESIWLSMTYFPNGLSMASPATVEYRLIYDGMVYTSGPLPFDEGNPMEPYGTWGMLDDGRVGGHLQVFNQAGVATGVKAQWDDICFQNLDAVPTESRTWGSVKDLYK